MEQSTGEEKKHTEKEGKDKPIDFESIILTGS